MLQVDIFEERIPNNSVRRFLVT